MITMTTPDKMTFDNTEVAFSDKTSSDLKRMYFLFSTMNNPWMARIGIQATVLALKMKLPIQGIIRKTIFAQFCGGISLRDSSDTINKLAQSNIKSILDFSAEGEKTEEGFESNKEEILSSLELAKDSDSIPTGVMKLTAFAPFDLLEKVQRKETLSADDKERFENFKKRVEEICQRAVDYDKFLFIDAEESWIQETIDDVVYEMMAKFNRDKVYIFNTYQLYRKDILQNMKEAHTKGQAGGYKIGAKLVRGAYMEKERNRAEKLGIEDLIQPDQESCNKDYNLALEYCIQNIEGFAVCAGTHNDYSCSYLARLIDEYGLDKEDPRVYFAQLYGMSDNISYMLSSRGYNVAKYLPYGPVEKVMPYLMRRAQENTSISGQSSREFLLVKKEMRRRK